MYYVISNTASLTHPSPIRQETPQQIPTDVDLDEEEPESHHTGSNDSIHHQGKPYIKQRS